MEIYFTFASMVWRFLWERLVRTVKNTLQKISGRSKLNFEELYTILTQVECMLNSRPLSCVYTEENCEPVIPSLLLLGRNLQRHWFNTTSDENIKLNVMKCKKCNNQVLKLINDLWKRFKVWFSPGDTFLEIEIKTIATFIPRW